MPAYLEFICPGVYALRAGPEARQKPDNYTASGMVVFRNGEWEIIAFTRRFDDRSSRVTIFADIERCLRSEGINSSKWDRVRNGVVRTVRVKR